MKFNLNADLSIKGNPVVDEIYVGDGDMPENAKIQIDMKTMRVKQQDGSLVDIPLGGSDVNTVSWENISDKPTFATVATSGSYTDLQNKPNIPANKADIGLNNVDNTADKNKRVSYADTAGYAPMKFTTSGFASVSNGPFSMAPVLRTSDISGLDTIPNGTYSMIPYVNVTTQIEADASGNSIANLEPRFYRCNLNDLLARVTELENRICLRAGTQITMADGSIKNIEDVQYGDVVLGYDVLTDNFVNVKSYGSMRTGRAHIWELLAFEDGRTVEIYDTHQLYSKTNGRMLESNKWRCGDYGIGVEGEAIQLSIVEKVGDAHEDTKYQIYTENGTCFANGILLGHDPWCCYRQYTSAHEDNPWRQNISEEEVAYFKELADIYENTRRDQLNTREYVRRAAPYFAKINIAKQEIEDRKAQLSGQDYKTIKHSQGKLSEEDFAITIEDCEVLRAQIAEYEAIVAENEAIVQVLKDEYTLTEWDRKQVFIDAFTLAMDHVRNNGLN